MGEFIAAGFWRSIIIAAAFFIVPYGLVDKMLEKIKNTAVKENLPYVLGALPGTIMLFYIFSIRSGIGWLIAGILFALGIISYTRTMIIEHKKYSEELEEQNKISNETEGNKNTEAGFEQGQLGYCYEKGIDYQEKGIDYPKDYAKAYELYVESANQHNGLGLFSLGRCYLFGIGVAVDEISGIGMLRKASALGIKEASEFLKKNNVSAKQPKIKPRLFFWMIILGVILALFIFNGFISSAFWVSIIVSFVSLFISGGLYNKMKEITENRRIQTASSLIPLIITLLYIGIVRGGIGWIIAGISFVLIACLIRFLKVSSDDIEAQADSLEFDGKIKDYIDKINNTPVSDKVSDEDKQEYILRLKCLNTTFSKLMKEGNITRWILKKYNNSAEIFLKKGTIGSYRSTELGGVIGLVKNIILFIFMGRKP